MTLIPADLNSKETGYYYPLLIDVTLVQNNRNKNNKHTDEAKGHAPRVMRSQVAARDTAGPIWHCLMMYPCRPVWHQRGGT